MEPELASKGYDCAFVFISHIVQMEQVIST